MSWAGGPAGGGFGGPSAVQSSAAAGLPFAGVPPELQDGVEHILKHEPHHPDPVVHYDPAVYDRKPFTLRRFLAGHRWGLLGALAIVLFETLTLQAGPLLTQIGIDHGIAKNQLAVLVAVAIIYVVSVIVSTGASAIRVAWTGRVGEDLMYDLRLRVFSHLQRLSLDFYTDEKAGRIMTRMTSDIDALSQLFQDGLVSLAVQGLTMIVVTIILFVLQPLLALVTVVVVVPAMTVLTIWFRSASDRGYRAVRERIAEVLADLQEGLSGIRIITAHNRRRHNVVRHRAVVARYRDANQKTARINAIYGPGSDLIGALGQMVVLAVGGDMVLRHHLSLGALTAFLLYLASFFAPIQQLVQLYSTYQSGQAAVAKLRDLLALAPGVQQRSDAVELPPIDGRIELDHVDFRYLATGPLVLSDITFAVAPGETVAFVGTTGAGKSTIAKLITRFYDVESGAVRVDGYDVRTLTLQSLHRQIGLVPQEPFLFAGSVRDNITFARPDATAEEVDAACHAVGIDELIAALPEGLDTPVHERGVSLSSGERQLLALARAFIAQPRVLVLDEATSSLDLMSEARVEHALDVVLEGRTAVIIAHRLATAMRADRIAVIEGGRLVEVGSHEELLALGGHYTAMHQAWSRHLATAGPAAPDH